MSLLEELKNRREGLNRSIELRHDQRLKLQAEIIQFEMEVDDIHRAIAALSVPEVAEGEIPEGSAEMDEMFEAGDKTDEDYEPESVERYPFAVSYTLENDGWGSCSYETLREARLDFEADKLQPRYLTLVLKQDGEILETFARPFEPDTITIASSSQHAEESAAAHDTDPVLGYKIDTSGETQSTLTGSAEREASNAFPGGVEGSRETSPISAEPWPITTSAPNHNTQETAQSLPPLFPPEPPQAATPESLRAGGIVDSEASYWADKLTKEPA